MVCTRWSWGPQAQRVAGSRGYLERHCYRVGLSPQYQFLRSLSWRPQPVALRAISEEILAQESEPEFDCNGHQVTLISSILLLSKVVYISSVTREF
jgi:hypothetical protein